MKVKVEKVLLMTLVSLLLTSLLGCAEALLSYGIDRACKPAHPDMEKLQYRAGTPDNIVKIDDQGSEVWEYYHSPTPGKVIMYVFLQGKLGDR